MPLIQLFAQGISAILFLSYGMGCLVSKRVILDFEHYRLPQLRVLTGVLQIAGALGVIVGHFYPPLLIAASCGLALMMLVAFVTRVKIRDPFYAAVPSFSLFVLNAYIATATVHH